MTLRSGIALCAIVAGLSGLTLCQPPTPRIARVEVAPFPTVNNAETKNIPALSSRAERVIQMTYLDDPLTWYVSHHR